MAVLLFWSGRNGTKGILSSISRNTNSCNWEGIICGTSTCWGLISWRQFCGEGLGGSQGEWADHEPAVQFHAKGGQQHTSQSVASRPREVTGDPSSCLALEATYEALCLLMGSSVQERQGFAWTSPAQGHKDTITGTEASFIGAGAESQTAGTVQPGEKKAQGYIITVYINLMGRHEGAFCSQDKKRTQLEFSSTEQHMAYLLCWFWPG